jgi:type VI secretion system protein ImpA
MPATEFEIEPLLTPLADDAPSGPDLAYDPEFQALEQAAAGTPERQYGDKVYPAEPPDWMQVHELALALATRTRDLRVAVLLTRSAARLLGLGAALRGLQLVQGLLERYWDSVHPQLDASDNNDPTMRLNALLPLFANDVALADLRAATLAPVRGSMTLRELELGLGADEPYPGETQPTEAGVLQGLQGLMAEHAGLEADLNAVDAAAAAIVAALDAGVGTQAPDAGRFTRLMHVGADAVARLGGETSSSAGEAGGASSGRQADGGGAGALRTRADAARELERICLWLEQNEPSNPAPLLLRRAQRLMNMSFVEIIRDMAPAGMDQVVTIVGTPPES